VIYSQLVRVGGLVTFDTCLFTIGTCRQSVITLDLSSTTSAIAQVSGVVAEVDLRVKLGRGRDPTHGGDTLLT
jgi:hypothetical protein